MGSVFKRMENPRGELRLPGQVLGFLQRNRAAADKVQHCVDAASVIIEEELLLILVRPRLIEKRVPDRQTRQACAVIRTKKARKNRIQEYNHHRMNLLRRSSNILQATVINGCRPTRRHPSPSLSVSRVGFASCQGFPPLRVPPLIAALENLLKPAFPSCEDKGVFTGRPGA